MKTRRVLVLLNAIVATESAVLLAVSGFWGIKGGKLAVVSVAVAACLWSALGDLEIALILGGKIKDGEKRERKNRENIVRGISGDEMQLQKSGRGHRDLRMHIEKVRTRA